ncbi:MAG TPA: helix-turn-helix domain-containing protein [Solirubrobacteraceae bacterium]|nr:helix-turn-helix domain-containing protein [Solirubrobacteraceae bacterium]
MSTTVHLTGELDPRESWTAERCTIAKALGVLSTRSELLIMREAFYGTTRFDDFAQRVGLSEPATAARLRELVDEGLLEREDYREPGQRTRQQYRLTEKGADLFPVLAALMRWGDRWLDDRGGPVQLLHHDCGEPIEISMRCAAGHEIDSSNEIDMARRRRRRDTDG